MCIRDRYQRRVRGSHTRAMSTKPQELSGQMEGAPAAPTTSSGADWTSMIPSLLPSVLPGALGEVGGMAVGKGLAYMQPQMGPWMEFGSCSFSKPQGLADVKTRVLTSGKRFLGNYAVLTCVFASLFVMGHPFILIALAGLAGTWTYLLRRAEPVVLMGRELTERQLHVLMSGAALLCFLILGAVEVILNGLFWGALISLGHVVLHEPSTQPMYDPLATEASGFSTTGELSEVSLQELDLGDIEAQAAAIPRTSSTGSLL
eukprot:TRINITY_DN4386_c0_g1_i3.p1 TRINITY_DN4386_c0_g1~~TRINITY_DN4386_c0_g1_i3.p1  ORF type:complete len:260 (+),score=71.50 TRINITY_DN4386_c0_g1_i3:143-922(+)